MPTYEYACRDCGQHLDVFQSFHDDPLTECPQCGGSLRKVFSAAGIIFKGSGWHVKDYASAGSGTNGSPSDNGTDTSASSDGGDSADTKTSEPSEAATA